MKPTLSLSGCYFTMMLFFTIGCLLKNHTIGIIVAAVASLTFVGLLWVAKEL